MNTQELGTLGDLVYIAILAAKSTGDAASLSRLLARIKDGSWKSWTDSNAPYVLGLVASTPDGIYWRGLIDKFAAAVGTTVSTGAVVVVPPAPVPVPVTPAPVPTVPLPADLSAAVAVVTAALATLNIHVAQNVLSVGIAPDPDSRAGLQVGGEADAEVLGTSNIKGTDGQNPEEVHKNVLSIAGNDGGFRMIQYGHWGPRGLVRNTLNRAMTIFAIDSMGDICVSDSRVPYGQVFYLVKAIAERAVKLCTFQVDWKLLQRESTVYGGADKIATPE